MKFETIIGLGASIATGLSLLPQLIKILKEKKAEAISYGMLALLFIGLSAWVYYGVLKKDWIIVASNSFSLLMNISIALFSVKYKK